MGAEWDKVQACCPKFAAWTAQVLDARCDQIAERGERKPPECGGAEWRWWEKVLGRDR
jgi:hypothetical protein